MTFGPRSVRGDKCLETVKKLDSMGIRFAGSTAEAEAADWIRRQFEDLGLEPVRIQNFPCKAFAVRGSTLETLRGDRWTKIPSLPAAHTPSTSQEIESDLVWVESVPRSKSQRRLLMEGKILLTYTSLLFRLQAFRCVMEAGPSGILMIDERFPNDWTVAIGIPRYWIDFISCPILNVPYSFAWDLVRQKTRRVRFRSETWIDDAQSQNVIGELRGSEFPEEIVVISGHHDSVINNPGADDNCTGVASVIELARVFAGTRPRRTLRFISYGAEEQLSEGALYYAIHAPDRNQIQFVLNTDSIGAHMGQTNIFYTGARALTRTLKSVAGRSRIPIKLHLEASPFSDHFPLNLAGIPSAWYYRTTFPSGRHFHHSERETVEVVSPEILARTVEHQALLLDRIANSPNLPFPRHIPPRQLRKLKRLAREWCGFEDLNDPGDRFERERTARTP